MRGRGQPATGGACPGPQLSGRCGHYPGSAWLAGEPLPVTASTAAQARDDLSLRKSLRSCWSLGAEDPHKGSLRGMQGTEGFATREMLPVGLLLQEKPRCGVEEADLVVPE